jgi:flagellar biosynthesis/type III secretory pathway chaperone
LSTVALQDIVEGQQRVTNGLVTLLSQERTSNDRSTRDHKQQLASLTALSQHFLTFMPDVEQKFSALEGSIRNNCPVADNSDLQNRVKDMVEVVANLGRIAEGFACSTGLRLVPVCSSIASSLPGKPP